MRKIFREIMTVEEAKKALFENYKPLRKIEEVELIKATGRILAEDVYTLFSIPPFDRAVMDGYAVKAEDTFEAEEDKPVILKVIGKVEAGEWFEKEINHGEAVEIATGAAIPRGANAVVMVEFTRERGNLVEIFKPVTPGENVMFAGSDIMAGELVLRKDTRITHREIALLSACGINKVKVYQKPKIAVISTGNELLEPGEKLKVGNIYDVNSYAICSAIEENGGIAVRVGIVRDDESEMKRAILKALETSDIVITTGSTSAGFGDRIFRILEEIGTVLVHGIAIKPGKPTIFAICNKKPVFGLPGYPISALTVFEVFVAPIIRELSGVKKEGRKVRAKLAVKVFSESGRREFLPVNVVSGLEGFSAYPVLGPYSGAVTALAMSDGFIEIGENVVMLEENEEVEVTLFTEISPAELVIIGSHCLGIDALLRTLKMQAKVINVGSTSGILAVKRGEADIAGTHLLGENGVYNEPVIRQLGVRNAFLVKGYLREQGIIVAKGNPKRIKSFEDFLREDIRIINRNRGSGTRILLDMHLKTIAEKKGVKFEQLVKKIKGYEVEAKTHDAVAAAILMNKADAGVGIRSVANIYDLDFIPIGSEEYDFLIPKEKIEKRAVREFLEALKSEEFARELERIGGLRVYERTGEMIEI